VLGHVTIYSEYSRNDEPNKTLIDVDRYTHNGSMSHVRDLVNRKIMISVTIASEEFNLITPKRVRLNQNRERIGLECNGKVR
jgi:hypothetical protein